MPGQLLFNGEKLENVLTQKSGDLAREIERITADRLVGTDEEAIIESLLSKYTLETPVLLEDQRYREDTVDVQIDVSRDQSVVITDRSKPFYKKGIQITVVYPFEGDSELFRYKPTTWSTGQRPYGEVRGRELRISYEGLASAGATVTQAISREAEKAKEYLGYVKQDVTPYNDALEALVRRLVGQRRNQIAQQKAVIDSIDIPPKRRS